MRRDDVVHIMNDLEVSLQQSQHYIEEQDEQHYQHIRQHHLAAKEVPVRPRRNLVRQQRGARVPIRRGHLHRHAETQRNGQTGLRDHHAAVQGPCRRVSRDQRADRRRGMPSHRVRRVFTQTGQPPRGASAGRGRPGGGPPPRRRAAGSFWCR